MAYTLYMFISLSSANLLSYLIYSSTIQLNITTVNTLNIFFGLYIYNLHAGYICVYNLLYRVILYCTGYIYIYIYAKYTLLANNIFLSKS